MNTQEIRPFFTSLFLSELNVDELQPGLQNNIYALKEQDQIGVRLSNRGGWQSRVYMSSSYIMQSNTFMDSIIEEIKNKLNHIYPKYGLTNSPELSNYWFNINKKYDYNISHTHPNSMFSAVLYVKVPADSGRVCFERPDDFNCYIKNYSNTEYSSELFYLNPKNNFLIIFPSNIRHYVEQNLTNDSSEDRISIAFNFV